MKTIAPMIFFTAVAMNLFADEKSPPSVVPQPRLRLDHSTHAPIVLPASTSPVEPSAAILLAPFVVRSSPITSKAPQQDKQPAGPFSLLKGGRLLGKDIGSFKIEAGIWPYFDIFGDEARFKDGKHVGVDFLRISW
jgi:hypothetical protein